MSRLVLGLDLGPNSIGWALVNDDPEKPAESKLVDLGVRVFPEGVDNFDTSKELSRNEDRRIARGMRRQIRRRARRRRNLKAALTHPIEVVAERSCGRIEAVRTPILTSFAPPVSTSD